MHWIGEHAKIPRVRGAIQAIILASAGLVERRGHSAVAHDAATGTSDFAVASSCRHVYDRAAR